MDVTGRSVRIGVELSPPAIHNPFFHVGFIVPDLDAAMEEFHVSLGIDWRAPIDALDRFLDRTV